MGLINIDVATGGIVSESRMREQYGRDRLDKAVAAVVSVIDGRLKKGQIKKAQSDAFHRELDSLTETTGFKAMVKRFEKTPTALAAKIFHKATGKALPGLRGANTGSEDKASMMRQNKLKRARKKIVRSQSSDEGLEDSYASCSSDAEIDSLSRQQFSHAKLDTAFNAAMGAVRSRLTKGQISKEQFNAFKAAMDTLGETAGFKNMVKKHQNSPTTMAAQIFHKATGKPLPGLRGANKSDQSGKKSMLRQKNLRNKRTGTKKTEKPNPFEKDPY